MEESPSISNQTPSNELSSCVTAFIGWKDAVLAPLLETDSNTKLFRAPEQCTICFPSKVSNDLEILFESNSISPSWTAKKIISPNSLIESGNEPLLNFECTLYPAFKRALFNAPPILPSPNIDIEGFSIRLLFGLLEYEQNHRCRLFSHLQA